MTVATIRRRLSGGVELLGDRTVHARVWAPACRAVEFVTETPDVASCAQSLAREPGGFFSGRIDGVAAGTGYWYRLDGDRLRSDPVSRFQPDGPHGPSEIVDPASFA
jgi:maltooligosyltrehalose trehalohydrolase